VRSSGWHAASVVLARWRRSGAKTFVTLVLEGRASRRKGLRPLLTMGSQATLAQLSGSGLGQGRLAEILEGRTTPEPRAQASGPPNRSPDARCAVARCRASDVSERLAPRKDDRGVNTRRGQLAKETSVDRCGNTLQWHRRAREAMMAGLKTIHRQLTTPSPSRRAPDTNFRRIREEGGLNQYGPKVASTSPKSR
jgi:hypothetical protein